MDEKLCTPKKIKIIITIVNRGKAEKVTELFKKHDIRFNIICLGRGTANSEILDYLGLGETEKDIVISVVHEENVQSVMQELNDKMKFSKPGNGIAFTIPITSVDGAVTLDYICGLIDVKKEWELWKIK